MVDREALTAAGIALANPRNREVRYLSKVEAVDLAREYLAGELEARLLATVDGTPLGEWLAEDTGPLAWHLATGQTVTHLPPSRVGRARWYVDRHAYLVRPSGQKFGEGRSRPLGTIEPARRPIDWMPTLTEDRHGNIREVGEEDDHDALELAGVRGELASLNLRDSIIEFWKTAGTRAPGLTSIDTERHRFVAIVPRGPDME